MSASRCLVLFLFTVTFCSAYELDDVIIGALRWYHRWILELPGTAEFADRTVAVLPLASFAYCEPGPLGIDVVVQNRGPVVATSITTVPGAFREAFADFVMHRYGGSVRNPTIRKLSVTAASLAACKVGNEGQQRRIPDLAIRNLAKPELWYGSP